MYIVIINQQRTIIRTGNYGNYGDFNARSFCRKQIYSITTAGINNRIRILDETGEGRSLKIVYKRNKMYKPYERILLQGNESKNELYKGKYCNGTEKMLNITVHNGKV